MTHHKHPSLAGGKHRLSNVAHTKKYILCALGVLFPFLVLFAMFPSGASLYKSYTDVVIRQVQVPHSGLRTGLYEAPSSSHTDRSSKRLSNNNKDNGNDAQENYVSSFTNDKDNVDGVPQAPKQRKEPTEERHNNGKRDTSSSNEEEGSDDLSQLNKGTAKVDGKAHGHQRNVEDNFDDSSLELEKIQKIKKDSKTFEELGVVSDLKASSKEKKKQNVTEKDDAMAWPEGTEKNGDNELLLSKKPQKEKYFSGEEKTGMRNAVDHTDDTPWLEVGEQGRTFGQPKAPKEKRTEKGKLKSATDVFVTDSDKEIFFRGENVSKNDDGRKVDWFYNQSNMPFIRQKSSSNHDLSSKNVPKKRRSNEYDEGEIWRSKQQVEYDDDENGLTEQEEKRNIANKVIHDSDEDAFTSKGKKNQLKSTAVLEDADKDHFMRKIKKYRHRNGIEDGYKLFQDLSRNKIVEDEEDEADFVEREKKGSYKEDIAEYADKDGGSTKRGKNKVPHVEHYLDEHNQMHIVGMSDEDEEAKKKKMRNKQKMDTAFEEIEDGDISFYDPLDEYFSSKKKGKLQELTAGAEYVDKHIPSAKHNSKNYDDDVVAFERYADDYCEPNWKLKSELFSSSKSNLKSKNPRIKLKLKTGNEEFDYGIDQIDHKSSSIITEEAISSGECRYWKGSWSMDTDEPPYLDSACPWDPAEDNLICKVTTDMDKWRWNPRDCILRQFEPKYFLQRMQGKSIAFVGDKMVKVQARSLICLLSKVETPELLYNTKANGSLSWNFKSWDVAISVIWSPFLVQRKIEDHYTVLQLDKLDIKWRTMMPSVNVLVLGVGSHFNQPILYRVRDEIVGCYSCQELQTSVDIKGVKELSLFSGFRATIRSSIMGIGAFPGFEGLVFFLQPFGFEGVGSFHGLSSKMKDIQETEIDRAFDKGIIHNDAMMKVIHTDLYALGKNDPIKAHLGDCLIPSPLADAWNQVLQNMLVDVSSHSSNIQ